MALLAQHTTGIATSLTTVTVFVVVGAYNWVMGRGGMDAFNSWLESKNAEELDEAARRTWEAHSLKDKDPSASLAMFAKGMADHQRALARCAGRQRAVYVCERAFVVMGLGCVGLWASLGGGPQWLQVIPFVAWVLAATVGGTHFYDLFKFLRKTGGPTVGAKAARPAPPPAAAQMGGAASTGLRIADSQPVARLAPEEEIDESEAKAGHDGSAGRKPE